MPAGPGRNPVKAMRRLLRLLAMLDEAGSTGVSAEKLITIGEYGDKDPGTQLNLDLKRLRNLGLAIDNVSGKGEPAHYRMVSGDNRLRLKLSPDQLAALQRAVNVADRADLAKALGISATSLPAGVGTKVTPPARPADLSKCLQAIQLGSRIDFTYKGTPRLVHPGSVRFQNHQWYLSGVEDQDDLVKHFAVGRMSDALLQPPGSARPVPEVRRIPLHPLLWEVDQPTEVVVRTSPEYVDDVKRWLQEPQSIHESDGAVDLTYLVTNRKSFRARIYVLGARVRITGPAEVRDEVLAELRELVGE
jgi:predicted DNA-binding transcriptional regulator YafY